MTNQQMENPVVLFDGVCNLCNGLVQFVLEHEKTPDIKFGALQSEAGQRELKNHSIDSNSQSILFIEKNVVYEKSDAVFKIAKHLNSPWSWIVVFGILPKFMNDYFYEVVAKYRYRLFGKSETCKVPAERYSSRFLI